MNSPPVGILFVGHGTRNTTGQRQFLDLATAIQKHLGDTPFSPAFLELASPSIAEGLKDLAQHCNRFITFPLLLFTAGHAKEDIPGEVHRAANEFQLTCLHQAPALEHHPEVLKLSQLRFEQALSPNDQAIPLHQRALVMLGRGSSSLQATRAMRHFTLKRKEHGQASYAATAFFAVAKPKPEELIRHVAQKRREELVVVQPHLLFDGLLWQEASELVDKYQHENPNRLFRIAAPLGADNSLAVAIAQMMQEITHRFRM